MPSNGSTNDKLIESGPQVDILIGSRGSLAAKRAGIQPMSSSGMRSTLKMIEDRYASKPVRSIRRKMLRTNSMFNADSDVHKFRMDFDKVVELAQTAPTNVAVEIDSHLQYGNFQASSMMQQIMGSARFDQSGLKESTVKIRIIGEGDAPLEGVSVTMEAAGFPQEGVTNTKGEVTLRLFELAGGNLVKSVFVRPNKGHWNRTLNAPALSTTGVNVIRLKSLADTVDGFPKGANYGWGQKLMGLDLLPDEFTGKGVKIAIIDSGADPKHPSLKHIKQGFDMTNNADTKTWKEDVIGHGSHCAGIITGGSSDGNAMRGFAPDAEIIVMKVFPGGQFSSLLDALSECIAQKVDVVNMSLGGGEASDLVEQQIEECVANGICCIVAAGNSGNEVQYPASSPSVLAVSAIGQINEVPSDTWEASTMQPSQAMADGMFSPSFTCHGPQIAVTGPGVGIISTVPGGAFDPQSGTSMATPHICGMAALLMAHHPDFKVMPRDATRVARLFAMMRGAATPLSLSPERVGSGLPLLQNVMGQFVADMADQHSDEVFMMGAGPVIGGGRQAPQAPQGYPMGYPQPAYYPAYAGYGQMRGIQVTPQGIIYH